MYEADHASTCQDLRCQAQKPLQINSKDLLAGRREVVIVHNGREYRLRETQNGKLILTA